jgi:hypothetical protein
MRRLATIALAAVLASSDASAEPVHGVYLEGLGKGGLWGLGYDHLMRHRLRLGIVGSGASLQGQRYVSASPYFGFNMLEDRGHALFVDAGAQVAHVWTQAPVPEWSGPSSTGIGGLASLGYEYRSAVLFRIYAHAAFGKGGLVPWAGMDLGFTF